MTTDFTLPKLGPSMESALLVEWLVAHDSEVRVGQVVAVVETEKVTTELEATADGIITLVASVDAEYDVGATLATIRDASASSSAAVPDSEPLESRQELAPQESHQESALQESTQIVGETHGAGTHEARLGGKRVGASPAARVKARENDVELGPLSESIGGRPVRRGDVDAANHQAGSRVERKSTALPLSAKPDDEPSEVVELSLVRRTIAKRLQASLLETAQITDVRSHEVSPLIALRNSGSLWANSLGFKPSFTDLFVRAVALALREVPALNVSFVDDRRMIIRQEINIGIAVAIPDGLIVAVVHGADRLDLRAIHERVSDLVHRARERRLAPDEVAGGTFTLTNIGSYRSQIATPILVQGQAGILGTGAFTPQPVVRDGVVVAGTVMHASLTIDHRLIDGETAGHFQTAFGELIATPERLL